MAPLVMNNRQSVMQQALRYYQGQPKPSLRVTARVNDNLPLPMARVIVDKGAAFLFGREAQSQILDADTDGPQVWLDEVWRRNKRGIFLQKLALNGGIFGHTFVRILEGSPYPRVVVLDPQTVDVVTNPDDIDDVWVYTITQPDQEFDRNNDGVIDETVRKRTLVERDPETGDDEPTWVIADQEYRGADPNGNGGDWVTLSQTIWPYAFSPVLGCQNIPRPNDYWGESDIPEDVIAILDGINRVASHYNKIIRLHASPKVWTRGMGSQKLDLSTDSVMHLPSETAELKALEIQSDLSSTMALLEKLLSLLSYAVRIPLIAMGQPDGAGALSGVSLQIRYQPLIEKTESKRLTYGDLLTEVDRCLLVMGKLGDTLTTQVVWPELLPKDPIQEREAFILDDQLGIASKHTISDALGYDYEQEQKRRDEEAQTAVDAMPQPIMPGQSPQNVTMQDHPTVQQGQQALGSAFGNLMQSKLGGQPNAAAQR
jgi:hypothetical protein